MQHEGPYREPADPKAEALKKMEKEIAAKEKFSIRLPEDIKNGGDVPLFEKALKKNLDPTDIVFYSLATGIVEYEYVITYTGGNFNRLQQKKYFYKSKSDPNIKLEIWVEKNKATFSDITTKEEAKKTKVDKEIRDWRGAISKLEFNSVEIKRIIKAGVNSELEKKYLTDLSNLKNELESLLSTIKDELEKNK